MRKRLFALIVGALLVAGPTSAWALAYTLSGPVAFNTNGVSGTINPVTSVVQ